MLRNLRFVRQDTDFSGEGLNAYRWRSADPKRGEPESNQLAPRTESLPRQGASPEAQAKYHADVMAATMMAGGQVVVDMAALIHRLRRDSDALRGVISDRPVSKTLAGIQQELHNLNKTMTAVQVMAAQMDIMNRHMASMSYSIGSTMGRMGDFMPF